MSDEKYMSGDNKAWVLVFMSIVICIIATASTCSWRNYEEMLSKERLIKSGVHPAIIKCAEIQWETISTKEICDKVLTNHNMSRQEAEHLIRKLDSESNR